MKKQILVAGAFASALLCAVAGSARAGSIAAAEALPAQTNGVTIDQSPVITAILSEPGTFNGKTYTSWSFLANDGTGSLDVFGKMPVGSTYVPTVGDQITATGEYYPFDQDPELESLTAINRVSAGNALPAIPVSSIPALSVTPAPLSTVDYLWTLNNVTITGGTGTFGITNLTMNITDSSNNTMQLYYYPTSDAAENINLFGMAIPTGSVDMTGFVQVYTSGGVSTAEFSPVTITPVPEPTSFALLGAGLLGWVAMLVRRRWK